jgi:hypothetical protein
VPDDIAVGTDQKHGPVEDCPRSAETPVRRLRPAGLVLVIALLIPSPGLCTAARLRTGLRPCRVPPAVAIRSKGHEPPALHRERAALTVTGC